MVKFNLTILIPFFFNIKVGNKNFQKIKLCICYLLKNLGITFGLFDISKDYNILYYRVIFEDLKDLIYDGLINNPIFYFIKFFRYLKNLIYYGLINNPNYLLILLLSTNLIVYSYI